MESSHLGIEQVLLKEFSDKQDQITRHMEQSDELLLVGANLYSTIQMHYLLLENRLKLGKSLRVLLVKPSSAASEMVAKRRYRPISPEQYSSQIESSLQTLSALKKETSGDLALHVIDYPVLVGGIYADMDTAEGRIFIWNHAYKSKEVSRPKLDLQKSDGYWFEFYCDEAKALWNDSVEWQDRDSGEVS